MKINTKLTTILLLISFIPLITASLFSYSHYKRNLEQSLFDHLESVASIQQARMQSIIQQNLERLGLVASRTQLRISLDKFNRDHAPEHQQKMIRILNDAKRSIGDFIDVSIYSLDGKIVASTNRGSIGNQHFDQDFFKRCQKEFTADKFYLDQYRKLRVYLSGPLSLGKNIIGVILIRSKVDNIIAAINDYSGLKTTGETVLAHRDFSGKITFITPTRFDRAAALEMTIPHEANYPTNRSFKGHFTLKDATDYRGKNVLAVTGHIKSVDWGLVVKIDEEEALAPIDRLKNILIAISLFYAISIVIISIFLANLITNPITHLARVASSITKGNLLQRADISSGDEISDLAESFNEMAEKLVSTNTTLEEKIAELNKQIVERRDIENTLKESQTRMKMALKGGSLGLWDWKIQANETYFSLKAHQKRPI